ncbi:MAG: DciA family protein [Patescibacteria group bacterium]
MAFQSFKRIIPSALNRSGINDQVSASLVVDEAKRALIRVWDEDRAAFVEPLSFTKGELHIAVSSPSALALLRTSELPWMNEINRALGSRLVLRIVAKRKGF